MAVGAPKLKGEGEAAWVSTGAVAEGLGSAEEEVGVLPKAKVGAGAGLAAAGAEVEAGVAAGCKENEGAGAGAGEAESPGAVGASAVTSELKALECDAARSRSSCFFFFAAEDSPPVMSCSSDARLRRGVKC